MALNPQTRSSAPTFRGLVTNADPHDIGLGAATVQNNILCKSSGQLQVRKGVRPGAFANATTPANSPVISACYYQRPEVDWIIYQLDNGDIKTGRSFA